MNLKEKAVARMTRAQRNYVVIIMKADGTATKTIMSKEPSLDQLQKWVGGYIEHVPYFSLCEFAEQTYRRGQCYANEHGKLQRMPRNEQATQQWAEQNGRGVSELGDYLSGDVVFVARTEEVIDA